MPNYTECKRLANLASMAAQHLVDVLGILDSGMTGGSSTIIVLTGGQLADLLGDAKDIQEQMQDHATDLLTELSS